MPIMLTALIVSATGRMRSRIKKQIEGGFDVNEIELIEAQSVDQALRVTKNRNPDIIIAEAELPKNNTVKAGLFGPDLGYTLRDNDLDIPVILLGNNDQPEQIIRDAILNGAISGYRLITSMTPSLWRQLIYYLLKLDDNRPVVIGTSPAIQALKTELSVITRFDTPVLILGESGTGKTILAKYIHHHSQRVNGPFVPVNCSAIPRELIESELFGHVKGAYTGAESERKGLFQSVDGGVLFLDEIGDMPLSLQSRLLRVIEEGLVRPVGSDLELNIDVRLISATHRDLQQAISEGCFRQDLYYRIQGEELHIPPLRKRKEDIGELAQTILLNACRKNNVTSHSVTLSNDVLAEMKRYSWPGNIRELVNLLERAIRRTSPESPCIESLNFPNIPSMQGETASEFHLLYQALRDEGMPIKRIADHFGISERQIYRRLKKHKLHT